MTQQTDAVFAAVLADDGETYLPQLVGEWPTTLRISSDLCQVGDDLGRGDYGPFVHPDGSALLIRCTNGSAAYLVDELAEDGFLLCTLVLSAQDEEHREMN